MLKCVTGWLMLCLALFHSVSVVNATEVPVYSDAVDNAPRFWREVMTHFYGPYDAKRRCWIGQSDLDGQPANFCMRPHKLATHSVDDQRTSYLVTAGYRINKDGSRDSCHACTGFMGMAILESTKQSHGVLARNSMFEAFGAWGQVPDEEQFSFRHLGPKNNYGWFIQSGWTGQGITQLWISIFGRISEQMRSIGTIPKAFDEAGNCEGGKHLQSGRSCSDYSYEIEIDTNDRSGEFFQIRLQLTGTRDGKNLDQTFRAVFDPNTNRYRLPDGTPSDR